MGDLGLIPGLGRSPRGGHGDPLQYSCLENPHGERSLTGYSTGGCKKSDRTDQLSTQHWEIGIISTYLFDALRAIMGGRVEGKPLELFFTTKIVNYKQYCIPGVTAEIGDAIKDLKNVGV